jgi:predicted GNAT family N-acyltransferase
LIQQIRYLERTPTPLELLALRTDAGWSTVKEPALSESLQKTIFAVCAETLQGDTIGTARVVGDGGMQLFVTDVIVQRNYRNQGIATELMRRVMNHIKESVSPDAFVGLFSSRGLELFYNRFGFVVRPNERVGAGMHLCITRLQRLDSKATHRANI